MGVQVKLGASLYDEMSGSSVAAGESGDRYYKLYMRMASGTVIEDGELNDAIDILETAEMGIDAVAGGSSLDFEAAGKLNAAKRSAAALLRKLRVREADAKTPAADGRVGQKYPPRALRKNDIIKLGKLPAVVLRAEDRGESVAVETNYIRKDGTLVGGSGLDGDRALTTFFNPYKPVEVVGLFPSDGASKVQPVTNAAKRQKGSGKMAVKVKKGTGKKSGSSKTKASSNGGSSKTRRTAEDVAKLVPEFRKHLKAGGTMRELKAEHGFSDDGPIRAALYRAGFDSKGEAHGEDAESINPKNAAGKKQLVALRKEGAPWYQLAYLAGITEGEAKTLVADAGGPTGRVYPASEKPAKSSGKSSGKKSTGKKSSGKKATAADPS
jgi:hypothetical protein